MMHLHNVLTSFDTILRFQKTYSPEATLFVARSDPASRAFHGGTNREPATGPLSVRNAPALLQYLQL